MDKRPPTITHPGNKGRNEFYQHYVGLMSILKTPCYGQYLKNGNCLETEKPSGRIHPCPVEYGGECLIDWGEDALE